MSAGQSGGKGADHGQDAELREDIERTRQELGETVEALAAKTDVTARARHKAAQAKEQAAAKAAQALPDHVQGAVRQVATTARRSNPAVLAAIAAGALLACIIIVRRSRK